MENDGDENHEGRGRRRKRRETHGGGRKGRGKRRRWGYIASDGAASNGAMGQSSLATVLRGEGSELTAQLANKTTRLTKRREESLREAAAEVRGQRMRSRE